ncbi:hypothetical protein ACN1C3_13430 [Pseudomonas sp. H11T01]|uniref:hypothetical protein n=1 Tax=Pseudomonas sp. H11T01 TaxID=3402749 RepID=UPI003AC90163
MLWTVLPLAALILAVVFKLSAVLAANNLVLRARLIILRTLLIALWTWLIVLWTRLIVLRARLIVLWTWLIVLWTRLIVLRARLIVLRTLLIISRAPFGTMLTLSPAILTMRMLLIIPFPSQQLRADTHAQQTNTCQTPDARLHAIPHCGSGPIHKTGKA